MKSINSAQTKEIGKYPVLAARCATPFTGIMVLSGGPAHCPIHSPGLLRTPAGNVLDDLYP